MSKTKQSKSKGGNSKQKMEFQTEVNQLLHLMIHSLYSNKEIFLRELISNAADACDKLRFNANSDDSLYEGDNELRIEIEADEESNTVTIRDNGIGMNEEDVINNIGTIAKSGTKEFIEKLSGDNAKDANLIGQFGVGFYSAFIVADKVIINTRKAGDDKANGVRWESDGQSGFSIETIERNTHGTEIILYLKDDEKEFAGDWRLRNIVSTYSDHIPLPVKMLAKDEEGKQTEDWETVNKANALWVRAKSEVSDDEYNEFYKHIAHDWTDPLAWSHNHVEGTQEYKSLLYIPSRAPFDLFEPTQKQGIKLYVQRVFIMDDTENLMPRYLRFVRGIIDSNDLPLNVSREILQSNRVIDNMRKGSVKKVLDVLKRMANKDAEKYQSFWDQFGNALKEGVVEDQNNKDAIAKLLRFATTQSDDNAQTSSLDDYIARMQEGQDKIYYVTAENYASAKNSPHLEIFKKKGIEVLLLTDRVDEWMISGLTEYQEKSLQSVSKGDLDLGDLDSEEDKKQYEAVEKESESLIKQLTESLGEKVEAVKVSHRLTDSPSCIVLNEQEMALYMQHLMKQAGHDMPASKPVLEINPAHPLVEKLSSEVDDAQFNEWASILFDQALLAEGAPLEDPAGFVNKLNKLMFKEA